MFSDIQNKVMLSFDTEEFDVPIEYGTYISIEEGVRISNIGINSVLDILKKYEIKATFFCTTNFALNARETMRRIIMEGHEVASHGCDHSKPESKHWEESKVILEKEFNLKVIGYRQPRMFPVDDIQLKKIGYEYNCSINPSFIPGRYANLRVSRVAFIKDDIWQIPSSVTPWFRFPLFWLCEHHLPIWLYEVLVIRTLKYDGYFNTYFHPWEFFPISDNSEYNIPYLIGHRSGKEMQKRLVHLIESLIEREATFITYSDFVEMCKSRS